MTQIGLQDLKIPKNCAYVAENLYCPHCGAIHIDRDIWAIKPHTTHLCTNCGNLFDGCSKAVSYPDLTEQWLEENLEFMPDEFYIEDVEYNFTYKGWTIKVFPVIVPDGSIYWLCNIIGLMKDLTFDSDLDNFDSPYKLIQAVEKHLDQTNNKLC